MRCKNSGQPSMDLVLRRGSNEIEGMQLQTYSSEQLGVSCARGARHGVVRYKPKEPRIVVTAIRVPSHDGLAKEQTPPSVARQVVVGAQSCKRAVTLPDNLGPQDQNFGLPN